jgi:hypothetical protein
MNMEIINFCMEIKYKFNGQWKKMHFRLFKKVNNVLFPYFPIDKLFNNILSVWTNSLSLVQKFIIKSTTSFGIESFIFDRIIVAHPLHDPSSSYILLPSLVLKIMVMTFVILHFKIREFKW